MFWHYAMKQNVQTMFQWETGFYTVVVLVFWKSLLQNFQPQRQWRIKILLPWALKFYTPVVLGRGVKVSVAIFTSSGGGV